MGWLTPRVRASCTKLHHPFSKGKINKNLDCIIPTQINPYLKENISTRRHFLKTIFGRKQWSHLCHKAKTFSFLMILLINFVRRLRVYVRFTSFKTTRCTNIKPGTIDQHFEGSAHKEACDVIMTSYSTINIIERLFCD